MPGGTSQLVGQGTGLANPQPMQWSNNLQPALSAPASASGFDSTPHTSTPAFVGDVALVPIQMPGGTSQLDVQMLALANLQPMQ